VQQTAKKSTGGYSSGLSKKLAAKRAALKSVGSKKVPVTGEHVRKRRARRGTVALR
jgi:hypothetical protein